MNGTVLHDNPSKRTTAETCTQPQETGACLAAGVDLRVAHELVAIAQGPDYCLCGNTWPCEKRAE
jgi:hypothetical protein